MADSSPVPERATAGAPRWVKVLAAIAVAAVVLVGVLLLTGGGHGPGRHTGSGDAGGQAPPSGISESGGGGHAPPAGGHAP